jgi:hypothetical protein
MVFGAPTAISADDEQTLLLILGCQGGFSLSDLRSAGPRATQFSTPPAAGQAAQGVDTGFFNADTVLDSGGNAACRD